MAIGKVFVVAMVLFFGGAVFSEMFLGPEVMSDSFGVIVMGVGLMLWLFYGILSGDINVIVGDPREYYRQQSNMLDLQTKQIRMQREFDLLERERMENAKVVNARYNLIDDG